MSAWLIPAKETKETPQRFPMIERCARCDARFRAYSTVGPARRMEEIHCKNCGGGGGHHPHFYCLEKIEAKHKQAKSDK